MAIKKQYLKSKPEVKITFEIDKDEAMNAAKIVLLSAHNQWQPIELVQLKNGKFKVVVNVSHKETDSLQCIFQATDADDNLFTILPAGADSYADNGMNDGGKNAVLNLVQ